MPRKVAKSEAVDSGETREMMSNGHATEDDVPKVEYSSREVQCGVGPCRPAWLQDCANIKLFTVTLSLWSLFGSVNFSYYTSVITSIEKEFGLPSSVSGFIKNVDNIGYMSTVLIFSHFCRYANKPRLFTFATILSSSAIFLFAVPHFIYGSRDRSSFMSSLNITAYNQTKQPTPIEYCNGVEDSEQEKFCGGNSHMRAFNTGAFALFVISELIQGVGQSPKFALSLTYMDDNAKDDSPKYFSFMFAMRAFSPVAGFMLGAWATSLYVDLSDPGIDQKDPRWVGAWWLGFVICALVSVVWVIPMILFPPVLKGGDQKAYIDTNDGGESMVEKAKDLPRAIGRLLRNKLYMLVILALCFEVYIMGYFTFIPKYLEQHYGVTASQASMITGGVGAVATALGPIVSGQIMTRKKLVTPHYAMKVVLFITALTACGYLVMMFLACPDQPFAGKIDRENPDLALPCNGNCSCQSDTFIPICGEDVNYYSPCHAGCKDTYKANGTTYFTDCQCIPGGVATKGMCPKKCKTLIPYTIALFFTKFVARMDVIPTMTIFMRCVAKQDKATSLALVGFILQIMSFPAPIVFGLVIDSACLVLQGCAKSRRGACLLYDTDKFRLIMHGFSFAVKAMAVLIYLVGVYVSKNVNYTDDEEDEKEKKAKELEDLSNKKENQELNVSSI